ncbi:MAG: hypothetical protein APF84_12420 [Gracilibacter sp. BRH_c7a]|nr:MAG: hypothetical protein APF84_12420 [Gracilibacter sp. BRH_c7a]
MMENISYLILKSKMSFPEVMHLPYGVFLSLLKHFRIFDIQQSPEGRKMLAKAKILYETEPEIERIKNSKFYKGVTG